MSNRQFAFKPKNNLNPKNAQTNLAGGSKRANFLLQNVSTNSHRKLAPLDFTLTPATNRPRGTFNEPKQDFTKPSQPPPPSPFSSYQQPSQSHRSPPARDENTRPSPTSALPPSLSVFKSPSTTDLLLRGLSAPQKSVNVPSPISHQAFYGKKEPQRNLPSWFQPQRTTFAWGSERLKSESGFKNMGNTCYVNASLQTLLNLQPFTAALKDFPEPEGSSSPATPVINALRSLAVEYVKAEGRALETGPMQVKAALAGTSTQFRGGAQQDVHEFLTYLLDQVHEEARSVLVKESELEDDDAKERAAHELARLDPVVLNFKCEIEHLRTCDSCHTHSDPIVEIFHHFSLDIPSRTLDGRPPTLQALLDHYFDDTHVEYKCEECGCNNSSVSHRVIAMPRVLVLHLKRFKYEQHTHSRVKMNHPIVLNPKIALSPPDVADCLLPPAFQSQDEDVVEEDKTETAGASSAIKRPHEDSAEDSMAGATPKRKLDFSSSTTTTVVEDSLDDDGFKRAIEASLLEAKAAKAAPPSSQPTEEEQLAWAIAESERLAAEDNGDDVVFITSETTSSTSSALSTEKKGKEALTEAESDAAVDVTPGFNPEREHSGDEYQLVNIIRHVGSEATSGHYVCDVFHPDKKVWKSYNDSIVSKITEEAVFGRDRQQGAYVLMYMHKSCFK